MPPDTRCPQPLPLDFPPLGLPQTPTRVGGGVQQGPGPKGGRPSVASPPGSLDGPWRQLRQGVPSFFTLRTLPFYIFFRWWAAGGGGSPEASCWGRAGGRCVVGWGHAPQPASWTPESPARRKPRPWRPLPLLIGRPSLKATGGPPARISAIKAAHA